MQVEVTREDQNVFLTVNGISATSETAARVYQGLAFTWEVEQLARHRQQAREIERLGVIAQGNASIVCKILDEKDAEIDRLREELAEAYIKLSGKSIHTSDCATSNAPAMEPGPCDCAALGEKQ